MASREELHCSPSAALKRIQQAGMKALGEKDVCGDSGLHPE
jgi:hypothetical protein